MNHIQEALKVLREARGTKAPVYPGRKHWKAEAAFKASAEANSASPKLHQGTDPTHHQTAGDLHQKAAKLHQEVVDDYNKAQGSYHHGREIHDAHVSHHLLMARIHRNVASQAG